MLISEALATLVLLVTLMGFIYTLHRGMERRMERRFDAIDRRFEALDPRFDAIDRRFDALNERLQSQDRKFERKFDAVHVRLDALLDSRVRLASR